MNKELLGMKGDNDAVGELLHGWEQLAVALNQHAIVSITNAAGDILYVNDLFCETSGYSRQELRGNTHRLIKSGIHSREFYKSMWCTISSGTTWKGEICNRRKDGSFYWVEATITPIFGDDKQTPDRYISIRTDITHSKQAEQRMRRGQDYANIGTWELNLTNGEVFWSERIERLFGYQDGVREMSYDKFRSAIHPDDRESVLQTLNAAMKSGEPYEFEHRVVWPDGSVHWVLQRGAVECDREGNPQQMLGVIQDINARKLVQLELEQNQRDLRQAHNVAKLATWYADIESRTLKTSDNSYEIYGIDQSSGDITLDTFKNAVHPDDLPLFESIAKQLEETGRYDLTHRIIRPSGEVRYVHVLGNPVRADDGHIIALSGAIQDITNRVELEQRLRDSEQRFSFAVEAAGDGVWDCNLQAQTIEFSRSCWDMLGYTDRDLSCSFSEWSDLVHPDDKSRLIETLTNYLNGVTDSYSVQIRYRCKNGDYKWIMCRGMVIENDDEGNPLRLIGINSDINDIKEKEQQLISARTEAEKANRAKSEFLSNMSHELRTPMNAILGFGQLLELDDAIPSESADYVHEIVKAGQHLLELINEVLDLAKVEAGRIILSMEAVSVLHLGEDIAALIGPIAQEKQIDLEMSGIADVFVYADKVRLKQVLINLITNAIKYNRQGGRVSVSTQAINDNRIRISVDDSGVGIPADKLRAIFEPFNRVDAEGSEIEGTGIGLTLTKKLVEMMDGVIDVHSTEGQGSRFWVDFPLVSGPLESLSEQHEIHADDVEETPSEKKKVLYIDDNPANLKLVRTILRAIPGIHFIEAHNSQLGLDIARATHPDLLLVDINMPDLNGYRVLEALRTTPGFDRVPIIAVSANAMPSDIKKGKQAGFDEYISKPFDIAHLKSIVRTFLKLA